MVNFDAALKDNYGPGLRNAVNSSNPILTESGYNDEDIIGRQAVWSVHTGQSASTGNRAEFGGLPSADRQRYVQVSDKLKFGYHTIKVSGPAKALTRNDTGSFVRALESEISGAEKDIKRDFARQLFGQALTDGTQLQTGVIATVTTHTGTNAVVTIANATDAEMRYFFVGMKIDFINPANGAVRTATPAGGYTVSAINAAARTVTVSDANIDASVVANDYLIRFGNFGTEVNGLRFLISPTQKYAGIDPAVTPTWGAVSVGSTTTQISELLFVQAQEKVMTDGDGSDPNLLIVEFAQRQKLASLLQAQKRYDGKEVTLQSGWKGLAIAGGTLLADRYCPTQDGFAVTTAEFSRFVGLDWTWDEDDGKILFKALDGSDAVEARFKTYHNMEVTNRNSHCRVQMSVPVF